MHQTASLFVRLGIGGLALLVLVLFLAGVRRVWPELWRPVALLTLAWVLGTAAAALSGVLRRFELRPPPFGLLLLGTLALGTLVGASPLGARLARLPLWLLVLAQAFRLPLELVMHAASLEGTMPEEMSYSGRNFDILTGASALVVAVLLKRGAPPVIAQVWNALGAVLLLNVVTVAVAASPLFKAFGNEPAHVNTFVASFPFVWLPAVLVCAALAGHVVIFRARRGTP